MREIGSLLKEVRVEPFVLQKQVLSVNIWNPFTIQVGSLLADIRLEPFVLQKQVLSVNICSRRGLVSSVSAY